MNNEKQTVTDENHSIQSIFLFNISMHI